MTEATHACFWLGGSANLKQPMFVAVDLHDANSGLVRPDGHDESYVETMTGRTYAEAERRAVAYAKRYSIAESEVHYDQDSTQCLADC